MGQVTVQWPSAHSCSRALEDEIKPINFAYPGLDEVRSNKHMWYSIKGLSSGALTGNRTCLIISVLISLLQGYILPW